MNAKILQIAMELAQEFGNITDVIAFNSDIHIKGELSQKHGDKEFKIHLHITERKTESAEDVIE